MLSEESSYKLLKQLEANPAISQRELAREMGMSLGKVNYCLRALIEKRSVKSRSVRTSEGKVTSLYELTNEGREYLGFYPVFTDGYKTPENSRSRLANRLRIRGL